MELLGSKSVHLGNVFSILPYLLVFQVVERTLASSWTPLVRLSFLPGVCRGLWPPPSHPQKCLASLQTLITSCRAPAFPPRDREATNALIRQNKKRDIGSM